VMEVSTGMIDGITARLLEVGTYHLQVPMLPDSSGATLTETAQRVAAVPGVSLAVPERQGNALLVSSHGAAGVTVRFVPPDLPATDPGFRSYVTLDSGAASLLDPRGILLSKALAQTLGVGTGQEVSLLTTWGQSLSGPPRLTQVHVSGVYETGYQELDKTLAYASLALADSVLSPRAASAFVGVKVADPFADLSAISRAVSAAAGHGARAVSWREIEYSRLASFRTTKALLLFIMGLIVLVASVNVSSSVLMIVFERRHDLGILKSVGAGPRSLALSFLLSGFATGLIGTALGIGLGLLVAVNVNEVISGLEWLVNRALDVASLVRASFSPSASALGSFTLFNSAYYLKVIPIRIDVLEVTAAAAGSLLLAAFASYIPASRASRVRPLEILRKV